MLRVDIHIAHVWQFLFIALQMHWIFWFPDIFFFYGCNLFIYFPSKFQSCWLASFCSWLLLACQLFISRNNSRHFYLLFYNISFCIFFSITVINNKLYSLNYEGCSVFPKVWEFCHEFLILWIFSNITV